MIPLGRSWEAPKACRILLQCPPRGTSSRVLSLRLRNRQIPRWERSLTAGGVPVGAHEIPTYGFIPSGRRGRHETRNELAGEQRLSDTRSSLYLSSVEDRLAPLKLALQRKSPDGVLQALLVVAPDAEVMRSIPHTSMTAMLKLLRARNLIGPRAAIHKSISPEMANKLATEPIEEVTGAYITAINKIVSAKRQAGFAFTLSDYTFLLDCVRTTGDPALVESIWTSMKHDGVTPNTTHYNQYLSAVCWSALYGAHQDRNLRVTQRNQAMRALGPPREERIWRRGIRDRCMARFEQMVRQGLLGDRDTFALMMVAMAREGDMDGVKSILKSVWDVDADQVAEEGDEGPPPAKHYPPDSHLQPTPFVLFTIAHAFGTNNDIPTALRLVDYVSRHYSVPIPLHVWEELLEWTFVLARPRYGRRAREEGSNIGQLPLPSVQSLWNTMTSAPYNVSPTMEMYDKHLKSLHRRRQWDDFDEALEHGRRLYLRSVTYCRIAQARYNAQLARRRHPSTGVDLAHRQLEMAELRRSRHHRYVRHWIRLTIAGDRRDPKWVREGVPDRIGTLRSFFPRRTTYKIDTGQVTLDLGERDRRLRRRKYRGSILKFTSWLKRTNGRSVRVTWSTGGGAIEPAYHRGGRVM